MIAAGQTLHLTIDKPVAGGRMLARHAGQVVLVRGAIPGERVTALVTELARGTAYADVQDVIVPSPDRRPVAGDPRCGGNLLAHVAYHRQLALKAAVLQDAFARIARLELPAPVPVRPSPERGYRMRARLHVRGGRPGFYLEGTHAICDPAQSGQLLPESLAALAALGPALAAAASVELVENLAADERAVHLELRTTPGGAPLPPVPGITGISCSVAGSRGMRVLAGSPTVADPLTAILPRATSGPPGATLRRHVRGFFQGNRYLLADLVGAVLSRLGEGPVVDLYAGVGLFGVAAAAEGRAGILAVEGDRTNAIDLAANAAPFGSSLTVAIDSVEHHLETAVTPPGATVVVDPPRTGVSPGALARLAAARPERIVYVSCDVATLARDARILDAAGYGLGGLEAFDLFPNTAHVESVAVFRRTA